MKEVKILDSLEMNKALQEGKRVRKINWEEDEYIYMEEGKVCYGRDNIGKYVNEKWVLLPDLPLLDKKEKEYLRTILRPFKGRNIKITKMDYDDGSNEEYIYIELGDIEDICFPNFKAGTMYNGLKANKEYTPEELELF